MSAVIPPKPVTAAIAALPSELAGIRRQLRRRGSLHSAPASPSGGRSSGADTVDMVDMVVEEGRLGSRDLLLVRSGMGRERAERALRYILEQYRPAAVLSLGFCGALAPSLHVGDLVLCSPLTALDAVPAPPRPVPPHGELQGKLHGELQGDSSLAERALRVSPPPLRGSCLTLPGIASDPGLKEWLSLTYDSDVVDMESFWLGRLAEQAGVPFLAVRSVSDGRAESLPPLDELVDDVGHLKVAAMSRYLLSHPQGIAELVRLARQARQAEQSLTRFALSFLQTP